MLSGSRMTGLICVNGGSPALRVDFGWMSASTGRRNATRERTFTDCDLLRYINSGYASPLVSVTPELSRQINDLRDRPDIVESDGCLRIHRQHPNTRFSNSFGYVRCQWDPHWRFPY